MNAPLISADSKACSYCHQTKPLSEFNRMRKRPLGGYYLHSYCKPCQNLQALDRGVKQRGPVTIPLTKVCPSCYVEKPNGEFTRHAHTRDGLQNWCKDCMNSRSRDYYGENRTSIRRGYRERWQTQRNRCLDVYGHSCACCGEKIDRFLTLDHINGGGSKHRKEVVGPHLYKWLIDNRFPPEFQTLCFNCNCGRYHNGGICPHKTQPQYENQVGVILPGPVGSYTLFIQ